VASGHAQRHTKLRCRAMLVSLSEQIIEALLAHNTARFFLIWMIITAAICVAVTLALVGAPKSRVSTIRPTNLSLTWRQVGNA
jgi:hypothetical protein